jgi:hypothetical protein
MHPAPSAAPSAAAPRGRAETIARRALPYVPLAISVVGLAVVAAREVLARTDGTPAVPLDDAYIHFQYARSIAEHHPFRYTPGATPTPGATSLLWPFVLSPFYAAGAHGASIIWIAWALGWASLGLLAVETTRLASGLVRREVAVAAGAMVVAFGGFTWFAMSGMEVVPFAWLLTRAARLSADWVESGDAARDPVRDPLAARRYRALLVAAALCPLMRPEGALLSLVVGGVLAARPFSGRRALALPAFAGPLLSPLVCFAATGQAVTSTAFAKWLPLNPYFPPHRLFAAVSNHVEILFGTLLDGRLWTSAFLPSGGRALGWLSLGAPLVLGLLDRRTPRALLVVTLSAGMLLPTTYETFLVNRLRYIWPFAAGFAVGLAAIAELAGRAVESAGTRLAPTLPSKRAALLFAAALVALLGSRLSPSIEDLAESASAISHQQVSLAKWAEVALPRDARIGVNDTGALAYFSNRATFDVVGLTTAGEARYWIAGPGSRFEHYEHLDATRLPTHFVVYPEWLGVPVILGEELASRTVRATILGGPRMAAYRARYDALRSGERPTQWDVAGRALVDTLDVADVESEAAHDYALYDAVQATDVVVTWNGRADGARAERRLERFSIALRPGGVLLGRFGADERRELRIWFGRRAPVTVSLQPGPWQEVPIPVPADLPAGRCEVAIEPADPAAQTFDALHYWSY